MENKELVRLIRENFFELKEDAKMEYLVHFAAPFTGGDECIVPKGTKFVTTGPMRDDAFYLHRFGEGDANDELSKVMTEKVKNGEYNKLFPRLQGFSFFITEEQLKTIPLEFHSGSRDSLLDIINQY